MNPIRLSPLDLAIAALLVLALAAISRRLRLGVGSGLLVAAGRMTLQLLLIGLVLKALFAARAWYWVALMAAVMVSVAGREILARQQRRIRGPWAVLTGSGAVLVSSFSVTVLALTVIIRADPWYAPQYAIPILGMLLGNTMNGIALAVDRLTTGVWQQRAAIEQRLMLGEPGRAAVADLVRDCLRGGLIPTINAMAVAGVVSLPGMMTGQILAGAPPVEAVKYQILIWLLIAAGTGFGMILAVHLTARRLFDERDRLRLERLRTR